MSDWISVEEQLPPDGKEVWILDAHRDVFICTRRKRGVNGYWWHKRNTILEHVIVMFWQPLKRENAVNPAEILCPFCAFFEMEGSTPAWSEDTGGDSESVGCRQGHWIQHGSDDIDKYRENITKALECGDYVNCRKPKPPKGASNA